MQNIYQQRGVTPAQQRQLTLARWLARAMDARWGLGSVRFGMETVLDLIPVIGGMSSLAVSCYQLLIAMQLTLPPRKLARMIVNVGVDFVLGLVPLLGDLADMFFRVHLRNQRIIDAHLNGHD